MPYEELPINHMEGGDWAEYRRVIIQAVKDNKEFQIEFKQQLKDLNKELVAVRIEAAKMGVRASVWGTLGGIIPALAIILIGLIMHFFR